MQYELYTMVTSKQLLAYAYKYGGEYYKIKRAIENQEAYVEHPFNHSLYVTILDKNYPNVLKQLAQPPWVLFYYGNLNYVTQPMVSVVGSRKPSLFGLTQTQRLIHALPNNTTVVSGMALGIDTQAHLSALARQLPTIAVLGCGIQRIYPPSNHKLYHNLKQDHLIISEYPNNETPYPYRFIARNRLVAALGNHLFVMAAAAKSGTLSTVDYALDLGRDVSVLAYPETDLSGKGCNELINNGAIKLTI